MRARVEEMTMSRNGGTALDGTFTANADAPRAARSALAGLHGDVDDELAFRLKVLVSEAVTNRVLDQALGGGRGWVSVEFVADDHGLRGTVADVDFADDRPHGSASAVTRDLEAGMMGAFSDSWGTTRGADGEISIWFEVLRGPAPTRREYEDRFAAALAAHA
jgi:anti-sigma regulatory factor (Ser/Thr protein kinase)